MAVDDHGIETLKKAAEEMVAGSKADYYHKVCVVNGTTIPPGPAVPVVMSPASFILFGSISAIASTTQTNILSYTVPLGKKLSLNLVEFGGGNIATYEITIGGTLEARRRTYFGGQLSDRFDFGFYSIAAGGTVVLRVEHKRTGDTADFEGRFVGYLDDA